MTRNNADFRNSVLFHSTVHPFQIGDIVEPRNGNPAYATTSLEYAMNHADRREDVEYNRIANEKGHEEAGKITGKVFEVEPLDGAEATGKGDDKGNVMSSKGFRVVKQVK
jgi:hypothetical protein